jgi:5-methylcytosine-specific restriction endonuclease McrA
LPAAPQRRRLKGSEQRKDARRISASAAGYDWYWSKPGGVADQVRRRDEYLCQECLREGGMAMAMEEMLCRPENGDGSTRNPPVDHIKPAHACTPEEFYDPANLEVLCVRHNKLKADRDVAKYGIARR